MNDGIRRAWPEDVPLIRDIYNEAIATTTGTFDTEPKTLDEVAAWFRTHGPRHAILVAERGSKVVGWASLSPFSDRPAYERTAELSVYVCSGERGRGVGTALVRRLLEEGERAGLHAVLSRISSESAVSLRIHESLGFRRVGTLREVGSKFGRLLDVHVLEYVYSTPPHA